MDETFEYSFEMTISIPPLCVFSSAKPMLGQPAHLLLTNGEMCVNHLHENIANLSQSALSQHLAKMREEGLLSYRRNAQTLYYKICDERVAKVIEVLKEIFCSVNLDKKDGHSKNQCTTSGRTH